MKKRKKSKLSLMLIALILVVSVGYALLTQQLNIDGISKINKATWKIYWDNVVVNENSVSGDAVTQAAEITNDEKTLVEYSITLSKPRDFYEFTVDAVNEGTIDAMVNVVSNKVYESNGTTERELPNYVTYKVTYGDNMDIDKNHLLKTGTTETYKVRVEFKDIDDPEELPQTDETLKFKFSVDYIQADKNAMNRIDPYPCTYDGELIPGAEYINGDYIYRYKVKPIVERDSESGEPEYVGTTTETIYEDGWSVSLVDYYSNEDITTQMCSSINNKPIVSANGLFLNLNVDKIDLNKTYTKNVKDMSDMFAKTNINLLDFSNFDTSNAINMEYMFFNSYGTSLNLNNFDTKNVKNMSYMFENTHINSIYLNSFDTSNVENMCCMFAWSSVKSLDLSSFNTKKVNTMQMMFWNSQATSLDLSSFNTSNVRNMGDMFNASEATILDLSSFDLSNIDSYGLWCMFANAKATVGYAKTQAIADIFNSRGSPPAGLIFVVKSS